MIEIENFKYSWNYPVPVWQNKLWFECWSNTVSQVYILQKNTAIIPICLNKDRKEYASWKATDYVFPIGDWSEFKNEKIFIPHLVNELPYATCTINSEKVISYVDKLPKGIFASKLRRAKTKLGDVQSFRLKNNIPEAIIDDILFHKKQKYEFETIALFIKELYLKGFDLEVHAIYKDGDYVAGNIGFITHIGLGHWIVSYNKLYAKYSPGHLLILNMLENALLSNTKFDFMRGGGSYKQHWRPVVSYLYETIL